MPTYHAVLSNKMNSTASRLDRNRSLTSMLASMLMPVLFGLISILVNLIVLFAEVFSDLAGLYRKQAASMVGSLL